MLMTTRIALFLPKEFQSLIKQTRKRINTLTVISGVGGTMRVTVQYRTHFLHTHVLVVGGYTRARHPARLRHWVGNPRKRLWRYQPHRLFNNS